MGLFAQTDKVHMIGLNSGATSGAVTCVCKVYDTSEQQLYLFVDTHSWQSHLGGSAVVDFS